MGAGVLELENYLLDNHNNSYKDISSLSRMLTTHDLYHRPGYGIEVGDNVRFILLRGLELRTFEPLKSRSVQRSVNRNVNRRVTGIIKNYMALGASDLNIEGVMVDGYSFMLSLSQVRDLKVLE